MSNRLFNDDEFTATEKTVKRVFGVAIALWVLGVLLSLGLAGVAIWAIIKLVTHFCA